MNLENLNLVELNALEIKEVDGGVLPLLAIIAFDAFFFSTSVSFLYHRNN